MFATLRKIPSLVDLALVLGSIIVLAGTLWSAKALYDKSVRDRVHATYREAAAKAKAVEAERRMRRLERIQDGERGILDDLEKELTEIDRDRTLPTGVPSGDPMRVDPEWLRQWRERYQRRRGQ